MLSNPIRFQSRLLLWYWLVVLSGLNDGLYVPLPLLRLLQRARATSKVVLRITRDDQTKDLRHKRSQGNTHLQLYSPSHFNYNIRTESSKGKGAVNHFQNEMLTVVRKGNDPSQNSSLSPEQVQLPLDTKDELPMCSLTWRELSLKFRKLP